MNNRNFRIGFVGLGVMGRPMALNLLRSGHELMVHDIRPEPVSELVAAGATDGESPARIGESCDLIFTMLPDSPEVREVIAGAGGVLEKIRRGSVIVDMSSITPQTAKEVAEAAALKGAEMLDAPVSGGEPKAIEGTLSIMVGGKIEVFDRIEKFLLVMGASAVHLGETGSGNIAKLANQIMVALHLASMSEAMVFAEKAGVDPEKVYRAIRGGLAGSAVLDAKMPLILKRDFKPGGPITMHMKDIANIRETAEDTGAPIPLTLQVLEYMKALKEDGHGMDDHCGIIQYWEKLAQ